MALTLAGYRSIQGKIHCLSGLHIGGSKDDIEIGGMDNPVIRNPLTRQPYVPGSSLKGKLRSLLEYCYGRFDDRGEPCGCADVRCPVCRLFGPHKRTNHGLGPTRLIVRDAPLTAASFERLQGLLEVGLDYAEVKTENMVNRQTQTATNARGQERVPAGSEFELRFSVRIFTGDDEEQLLGWLGEALALLERDALGGSGSRGSGEVKLVDLTRDGQPWPLPEPRCGG